MFSQRNYARVLWALALPAFAPSAWAQATPADPAPVATASAQDIPDGWIPPGWIVIEGDIQVPEDFLGQAAGTYVPKLWSGKTVPFEFAAGVTQASQTAAVSAMADWEAVSDVVFVPRTNQANWVRFQNSTSGNNSAVGMVGGMQVINIQNWNAGTLRHELGHCLGLWHEQSRADRDAYITVNYGNICQTCCNGGSCSYNFDIRPEGGEYGPYDFQSIMHYSQWAFSVCSGTPGCETIVCKPAYQSFQNQIGTFNDLSFWDARVMSFLYAESDWRFLDDDAGFLLQLGTFFQPYWKFAQAVSGTPTNGVLWIQPGNYADAVGAWSKPMTIRAPLGGVTLGD